MEIGIKIFIGAVAVFGVAVGIGTLIAMPNIVANYHVPFILYIVLGITALFLACLSAFGIYMVFNTEKFKNA